MFVENHKDNSDSKRLKWAHDLKKCLKIHTQTISTRLRMIQFNWIMRTYLCPVQLNKFDPNIPDLCYKCTINRAHYITVEM